MNAKKMAIAGSGLIAAGIGLGAVGAALVLPAIVSLTAGAVKRVGARLVSEIERGSIMAGTAAGTVRRSMTEAPQAGVTEKRTSR